MGYKWFLFCFLFLVEEDFDGLQEVYSEIVDREKKDNNMFLYFRNDFDELWEVYSDFFFFLKRVSMTFTPW